VPRHAAAAGPASGTPAVQSKLVSLAAHIEATSGSLPGNASLIIRTQAEGTIPAQVSYNLYTDSGAYYGGGNKQSLMEAVAQHQNMAGGADAREVAAARYAVTGNLATAREQMNNALHNNDYYLPLAQRQEIWAKGAAARAALEKAKGMKVPLTMPTGQTLQEDIDNSIWNNSMDALSAGAGNPQVREGVLRLLSTIPEVAVANSTTGGVATLTLTAGPALFGGGAEQMLTINAQTGMPIRSVFPAEGGRAVVGADLPGLPGDDGRHRVRQVLTPCPALRGACPGGPSPGGGPHGCGQPPLGGPARAAARACGG
jgi:hypothetical protein